MALVGGKIQIRTIYHLPILKEGVFQQTLIQMKKK